jgi:hypothetical protein
MRGLHFAPLSRSGLWQNFPSPDRSSRLVLTMNAVMTEADLFGEASGNFGTL